MIAVLTGDIIGSRKAFSTEEWMLPLRELLNGFGASPEQWEIYRGDSFQLEITDPKAALEAAILIKSTTKKVKNMDVRIAIGIGEKTFRAETITASNGSAFVHSGDCFEQLREEKRSLAIKTGNEETDEELNTLILLGLALMDRWTPSMADLVSASLHHPEQSQQETADFLNVRQSTVSAGLKRAHFSLIRELNQLYRKKISAIFKI